MHRRALTLIEMVVALVLGALLLGVMTSAIRRSLIEVKASAVDPYPIHATLLLEQLGRDLANARKIAVGSNRLELMGFLHRDPQSLISTLRPAWVRYEIRRNGPRYLLVRVQSIVANGVVLESISEAVAAHIRSMEISTDIVGALTEADGLGKKTSAEKIFTNRSTIPASVRIVLTHVQGHVALDHTFRRLEDGS